MCLVILLLSPQARRAEEAKQIEEDKKKRDRDNAARRVAGAGSSKPWADSNLNL